MKTSHGYKMVYAPDSVLAYSNGMVYLHRLIALSDAETATNGQIIHHIDGNRTNNEECNIAVTTRSEHGRIHVANRNRDNKGRFV